MTIPVDLTGNHLRLTRSAAHHAETDPTQSLVAIVFAAAAFEAWLASVVLQADRHAANDPAPIAPEAAAIAATLPELEQSNAQWKLKLQVVVVLLTGRPLDRGAQPWQDVELLFRLRNLIVHPALTWNVVATDAPNSEPHLITRALLARGIIHPPIPLPGLPGTPEEAKQLHAPPTSALFQAAVARWAHQTVLAGIRGVVALAPESTFRRHLEWWLEQMLLRRLAV